MKIALDAKRIFHNTTGLGVYGRNLVSGLNRLASKHDFILYSPKVNKPLFDVSTLSSKFRLIEGSGFSSYYWRTCSISKSIKKEKIDIYHGLSNELPLSIKKSNAKSIVDIHDLCFLKFPSDYSKLDQHIFHYKAKHAAMNSDKIIATSQATKKDILQFFNVHESKVEVVYQSCAEAFYKELDQEKLNLIKSKYSLPSDFILSVGTIQGRKNQKLIVQAMSLIEKSKRLPIVLVGSGGNYLKETQILAKKLDVTVELKTVLNNEDLPAIYQLAKIFVYPSLLEGFGIPVLEAMASKVPCLSSSNTSMSEILQNEDCLINPKNSKDLADKILHLLNTNSEQQVHKNYLRALEFSNEKFASSILKIYETI
ncbi:MAG: glycosyltransferase family 1 protein [Chitinophagales bacterium]